MNTIAKLAVCLGVVLSSFGLAFTFGFPKEVSVAALLLPVIFLSLSLTFLSLLSLLPIELYFSVPTIILAAASFAISKGLLSEGIVLSLGFLLAALLFLKAVSEDKAERVRISVTKSVEAGLSTFFFVFLLSAAFSAYLHFQNSPAGSSPADLIPPQVYEMASGVTSGYFSKLGCAPADTLDSCVSKIAAKEMERNILQGTAECSTLSEAARANCETQIRSAVNAQLSEFTRQIRENLLSQLDPSAKGSESLSEILNKGMKLKAAEILRPFEKYVPGLMAVLVYSTLNLVSFIAAFLTKILSEGLFSLLLSFELVSKKTVKVDAQVLE